MNAKTEKPDLKLNEKSEIAIKIDPVTKPDAADFSQTSMKVELTNNSPRPKAVKLGKGTHIILDPSETKKVTFLAPPSEAYVKMLTDAGVMPKGMHEYLNDVEAKNEADAAKAARAAAAIEVVAPVADAPTPVTPAPWQVGLTK